MPENLPSPLLQYITPKKLAWVMNVGDSTVADWIRRRELEHFRMGRLIRFAQDEVLHFIWARTVKSKTPARQSAPIRLEEEQFKVLLERIGRLLSVSAARPREENQIESRVE